MPADRPRRSLISPARPPVSWPREDTSVLDLASRQITDVEAPTPRVAPSRAETAPVPQQARHPEPAPTPAPPARVELIDEDPPLPPPPPPVAPGRRPWSPLWWVPGTFTLAVAATVFVTLSAWFLGVSPRLHAALDRREAAARAAREAEVAALMPPPAPIVAPPVVAAVVAPVPEPELVAIADPPRLEPRRAEPRPVAVPEPRVEVREIRPEPKVEPRPEPRPEPRVEAARVEPPDAPPAAKVLDGRYAGTAGGKPLLLDLAFKGEGRVVATVQRGAAAPITTTGRYTLSGDRATLAFVEPDGDGASYSGMISSKGVSGRIVYATGKTQRFSVSR